MSAFIVSPETMNRAVLALEQSCCPPVLNNQENLTKTDIGILLYDLNEVAVNERYCDDQQAPEYNYRPPRKSHPVVLYKALQCLVYQCTESDVPRTELYQYLQLVLNSLARDIIQDLPSYREAEWDAH